MRSGIPNKLEMFLQERDAARARHDVGVVRSLTADLRRWGVPDEATLENPTGEKRGRGRPKKPRCEHGAITDHCVECSDRNEMVAAQYSTRHFKED